MSFQADLGFTGVRFADARTSGAHLRSAQMKLPNIGQKKYKAIEQLLSRFDSAELNARANPTATAANVQQFNELRSDMAVLHDVYQHLHALHFSVQELKVKWQDVSKDEMEVTLTKCPFLFLQIPESLQAAFNAADKHVIAVATSTSLANVTSGPAASHHHQPTSSIATRTAASHSNQPSPATTRESS